MLVESAVNPPKIPWLALPGPLFSTLAFEHGLGTLNTLSATSLTKQLYNGVEMQCSLLPPRIMRIFTCLLAVLLFLAMSESYAYGAPACNYTAFDRTPTYPITFIEKGLCGSQWWYMESYPPNLTSCVIGNSTPAMLANYTTSWTLYMHGGIYGYEWVDADGHYVGGNGTLDITGPATIPLSFYLPPDQQYLAHTMYCGVQQYQNNTNTGTSQNSTSTTHAINALVPSYKEANVTFVAEGLPAGLVGKWTLVINPGTARNTSFLAGEILNASWPSQKSITARLPVQIYGPYMVTAFLGYNGSKYGYRTYNNITVKYQNKNVTYENGDLIDPSTLTNVSSISLEDIPIYVTSTAAMTVYLDFANMTAIYCEIYHMAHCIGMQNTTIASTSTTTKTTSVSTTTKTTSTASTIPSTTISSCGGGSGCYNYDEQIGEAFGSGPSQTFGNLSYAVTAVAQSATDGIGPAYFLNGYTNQNYWYQIGLAYNWTRANYVGHADGFGAVIQVWNDGSSVYGLNFINLNVKNGDKVRLSLNFSTVYGLGICWSWPPWWCPSNDVVMSLTDLNDRGINYTYDYPANGNDFIGGGSGQSTGLMTEEYYYSTKPYFIDQAQVTYTDLVAPLQDAMLSVQVQNVSNNRRPVPDLSSPFPSQFNLKSNTLNPFINNGTLLSKVSAYEFVTGNG